MFKSLFAAAATLALFAGTPAHAYAKDTTGESVQIAAATTITADQAGRVVMQSGEAIGTLTEVMADENLAVISLTDGSEKQVALSDLSVAADGSIELAALTAPADESAYE